MDTNRRDFMKMSAMAATTAVAGWLLPHNALAAAFDSTDAGQGAPATAQIDSTGSPAAFKTVGMEECQSLDHNQMAIRSPMVQAGWRYLEEEAGRIGDAGLRGLVVSIYADSTPTFPKRLEGSARRQVWEELTAGGHTKQSFEDFLPPLPSDMAARYPAISAPGSGYTSHHAYPGGLITHVATNVKITAAIVKSYAEVYDYNVNRDISMAAQLLHDLHKPYVFQWREDGSSRTEQTLSGGGEHHVLSLAELLVRGAPAELVVAQACAHTHPGTDADEASLVSWLKAAAIIAGIDPVRYGLLGSSGKTLPLPRRQEGFICHLGDHDFVLSVPAVQWTLPVMREIARKDYKLSDADLEGKPFNQLRNMVYSQASAMRLEQAYTGGVDRVRELMHSVVKPA